MNTQSNSVECPQALVTSAIAAIQNDESAGLAELDRLLATYGRDARLHFLRGSVLAGLRRYQDADVAMNTAVDLAPGFHIARFQSGFLKLTSGNAAAAAETWRPLAELAHDHPLRLFAEGLLHLAGDRPAEAITAIRMGMALNAENMPLNRDMQLILNTLQPEQAADVESADSSAHHLLQQYTGQKTRH